MSEQTAPAKPPAAPPAAPAKTAKYKALRFTRPIIIPSIGRIESGPELFLAPDKGFQYAQAIVEYIRNETIEVVETAFVEGLRKIGLGMLAPRGDAPIEAPPGNIIEL